MSAPACAGSNVEAQQVQGSSRAAGRAWTRRMAGWACTSSGSGGKPGVHKGTLGPEASNGEEEAGIHGMGAMRMVVLQMVLCLLSAIMSCRRALQSLNSWSSGMAAAQSKLAWLQRHPG